jgi:methylation protein EvaC
MMNFGENVRKHRDVLLSLIKEIKSRGKRIIGYGAPGRGNTLLNFCNIDTKILDYITDESPTRQGKVTPGTHIPIVPPEIFRREKPDFALMLAWSYMKEILEKEKDYVEKGGRFVVPLPMPKIIP